MLRCTSHLASSALWLARRGIHRIYAKSPWTASRWQSKTTATVHSEAPPASQEPSAPVTRFDYGSGALRSTLTLTPSSTICSETEAASDKKAAPTTTTATTSFDFISRALRSTFPSTSSSTLSSPGITQVKAEAPAPPTQTDHEPNTHLPSPSAATITTPSPHASQQPETKDTTAPTAETHTWPAIKTITRQTLPRTASATHPTLRPARTTPIGTDRPPLRSLHPSHHDQPPPLETYPYPYSRSHTAHPHAAATTAPSRSLQSAPTWVHMDNLPADTTKPDLVRALMTLSPTGRILALLLAPGSATTLRASLELDTFRAATALLARAHALTVRGVAPTNLRLEVKDDQRRLSVALSSSHAQRPSRVLRVKATAGETALVGVERIRGFLRAHGVDDEVEWAGERAGRRKGERSRVVVVLRFCCWRYQAYPALALLRRQGGLGVWYAPDPCEVGTDRGVEEVGR